MANGLKGRAHLFGVLVGFRERLRSGSLLWDTLTTTTLSAVGKSIGFVIPLFIATWFGVSGTTDAFFFAYSLILFLAMIVAPVMESLTVPFIVEARARGEDVDRFVSQLLLIAGPGMLGLCIIFLGMSPSALRLLTRFSPEGQRLVQELLFVTAPLTVLLVLTSIFSGTLNAHKVFVLPALSPAVRAVITLAVIALFKDAWGANAIAWGYVLGEASRLIVLAGAVFKLGLVRLRWVFPWDGPISGFFKTGSYQLAGVVANALNPIINKAMASWIGPGAVSLLEYAERLYMIPVTLLGAGALVPLLTHWSLLYSADKEKRFQLEVARTVKLVTAGALAMAGILALGSSVAIPIAYGYGEFPVGQLGIVQRTWIYYLIGLAPHFAGTVYMRALLVRRKTGIIVGIALAGCATNILLNWVLMRVMGVPGIALATTAAAFGTLILASCAHRGE